MSGKKGFGAKIQYETTAGSSTWTDFANVTKIRPFNMKTDVIDVTAMDSANEFREKLSGLKDPGQAVFDLNYDPAATSHLWMQTNIGVVWNFKVTFPGTSPKTATFSGFINACPPEVPFDNKMTCSVTIEINGVITIA